MRWTIPCIVACSLLLAEAAGASRPAPHATPISRVAVAATRAVRPPVPVAGVASLARHRRFAEDSCLSCHRDARGVLTGAMGTRAGERAFAHRALGAEGEHFFAASCAGCHVTRCADCHGTGTSFAARPADEACMACHRGYWTGWDYHGHAAREDHERYQRGPLANGEHALKMLADVHAEAGLTCADCHTMRSLQEGRRTGRTCRDCHPSPSPQVPEHAIAAHLKNMECWACHAAWASQEYGTFLVMPRTPAQSQAFAPLPLWGEWRKSAYLKRQDPPPLGLDERGLVAPIRPEFILFATDPRRGWENKPLANEWTSFFPHTIRRGTTTCLGCHDTPRRFLLENDSDRVYRPDEDGLPLRSFWNRSGQSMRRGAFFPAERYRQMNRKSPTFVREHLKQWQSILDHAGRSSAR